MAKILSETKEQAKFVVWCREQGFEVCALAQNTFTNSWKALNENIALGVVKGFPDLAIVIPGKYRIDNEKILVFIEMKKIKGGKVSKEQIKWISLLNECKGVQAAVCYGRKEAINYILNFLEVEPPQDDSFIKSLK